MEKSKLYKLLGIIMGTILLIILLVVVFMLIKGSGASYSTAEESIKEATKEYYKLHAELLPEAGRSSSVSAAILADEGLMAPLDTIITKAECSGTGKVYNNGVEFVYSSSLDCGDKYASLSGVDYLLSKNEVKVDGSGLYEETVAFPSINEEGKLSDYVYNTTVGETSRWVYKGKSPNNHARIDGDDYIIVSFSEQDIELIMNSKSYAPFDSSYNEITGEYDGKNVYYNSEIVTDLEDEYNYLSDKTKELLQPHSVCIGSREENALSIDGKTECRQVVINQKCSLIPIYEVLLASSDPNCKNNLKSCSNGNYFNDLAYTWTSTPLANTTTSEFVYNEELLTKEVDKQNNYMFVITVSPDVEISGTGTEDDPFVLEG